MSGLSDLLGGLGAVPIRPGVVFLNVWNCRADVARFYAVPGSEAGEIASEIASNSDELSDEAAAAVSAQGGAINWSGLYWCPGELAARAHWE